VKLIIYKLKDYKICLMEGHFAKLNKRGTGESFFIKVNERQSVAIEERLHLTDK